jgi:hypothetical protein
MDGLTLPVGRASDAADVLGVVKGAPDAARELGAGFISPLATRDAANHRMVHFPLVPAPDRPGGTDQRVTMAAVPGRPMVECRPSEISVIDVEGVMAAKKKWSERSRLSRGLIVASGAVEVVLLVATLIDIKRRPAGQINGSKRMWTLLAFINIVGPIAYFAFGRRRSAGI